MCCAVPPLQSQLSFAAAPPVMPALPSVPTTPLEFAASALETMRRDRMLAGNGLKLAGTIPYERALPSSPRSLAPARDSYD